MKQKQPSTANRLPPSDKHSSTAGNQGEWFQSAPIIVGQSNLSVPNPILLLEKGQLAINPSSNNNQPSRSADPEPLSQQLPTRREKLDPEVNPLFASTIANL